MDYKIEKGIKIPKDAKMGRKPKYPWNEMEVGDSFSISAEEKDKVRSSASHFSARNKGYRFAVYKNGAAYRVWRVK